MAASKKRVGIVGAAISGPVFALQILSHPVLKERYKPILFEQLGPPHKRDVTKASQHQKPVIHTAGAAVGIFSNGLYPLFELGLRPDLEEFSCEMADLDVWRGNLKGQHRLFNNLKNAGWDAELRTCPRIFERQRLRDSLLRYVLQLGGEIKWDAKVRGVRAREKERPHISLENGETVTVDLLVGADGTWSLVRKFIMEQRNRNATEKRWPAPFTGVAGIYGISSSASIAKSICGDGQSKAILVLLDRGNIGALPLEDGKIAWTMHLPETKAPERSNPATASKPRGGDLLESKMVPGVYDPNYTAEILRAHQNIFHPELGSFKHVFESSERIIHSPLRQQVWNEEEIQWGNIALIGDAARVMPPYTGQGSSMGIEDATVMADALLNNPPPPTDQGNFRAALTEYAQRRVTRSKKLIPLASWSATLSMGNRWWWRWLRDIGARLPTGDPKVTKPSIADRSQDWLFKGRLHVRLRDENRHLYEEEAKQERVDQH